MKLHYWDLVAGLLIMPIFFAVYLGAMRILWCLLLVATVALGAPAPAPPGPRLKVEPLPTPSTNRVLLVKPKANATPEQLAVAVVRARATVRDTKTRPKWRQLVIPTDQEKHEVIASLKASGLFEQITEPKVYKTQDIIPNDPMFPQLWGRAHAQCYFQDFSSRTMPPGWREWGSGFHMSTWDNQLDPIPDKTSVIFGDPPLLTEGALYTFGTNYSEIAISFLFKVPMEPIPDSWLFEVIDLYDGGFNEICDLYLTGTERLSLSLNDAANPSRPIELAPPKGTVIRVWLRYALRDGLITASAEWGTQNDLELRSGPRWTQIAQTKPGRFPNPLATELLFGPWHSGFTGVYTDLLVTAKEPERLTVTIAKATSLFGPWITFTNFTDTITGPAQFYRLQAQ